ncbi:MAG TPA: hypothetical protein VMW48_02075, partial [Vicinamibacterales bacterium]|nr:hypothetical protein [Vicinamibacterales bacterium]
MRRALPHIRAGFALALLLGAALPAPAAVPDAEPPRRGMTTVEKMHLVERNLTLLRIGIAGTALVLLAGQWRRRRQQPAARASTTTRVALGALALGAFACNYNLFVWTGHAAHEMFHYYLGSKYFPEVGYTRLYECVLAATLEPGERIPPDLAMNDLRTNRIRPAVELVPRAPRCNEAFSEPRWHELQHDARWFEHFLGPKGFRRVLRDHGYNPSPVWNLVGSSLSSTLPAQKLSLRVIGRVDLILL